LTWAKLVWDCVDISRQRGSADSISQTQFLVRSEFLHLRLKLGSAQAQMDSRRRAASPLTIFHAGHKWATFVCMYDILKYTVLLRIRHLSLFQGIPYKDEARDSRNLSTVDSSDKSRICPSQDQGHTPLSVQGRRISSPRQFYLAQNLPNPSPPSNPTNFISQNDPPDHREVKRRTDRYGCHL
jgi:hypothetical protein